VPFKLIRLCKPINAFFHRAVQHSRRIIKWCSRPKLSGPSVIAEPFLCIIRCHQMTSGWADDRVRTIQSKVNQGQVCWFYVTWIGRSRRRHRFHDARMLLSAPCCHKSSTSSLKYFGAWRYTTFCILSWTGTREKDVKTAWMLQEMRAGWQPQLWFVWQNRPVQSANNIAAKFPNCCVGSTIISNIY